MPDPTAAEVRTTYALAFPADRQADAFAEFDRWLAGVKAQALREAARRPGPYPMSNWKQWLRDRADEEDA